MNTMAPAKHFLRKTIFPCDVDGHMIVLDLAADRYSRLGDAEAAALRYMFRDDPTSAPEINGKALEEPLQAPETPPETPEEAQAPEEPQAPKMPEGYEAAVKTLIEQGILAEGPCEGKGAFPAMPAQATLDMKGWPHDGNPKIRAGHVINCARAFMRAKFMRRFYSIERIVARITRRRERALKRSNPTPKAELDHIRELVEVFRILKVLFYTAKDHCLFDSLTLVEFLSFYRIYPLWVFGVQMGPFGAHCWVQDSTHIYNDSVTHTDFFTPIMSA